VILLYVVLAKVTVSDVVDVAVTEYILNPETAVDRLDVTPPEKVAVTLSGTLIITIPEPPPPDCAEPPEIPPPPPPPPVLAVPLVAAEPVPGVR
jgi:hypothetical protein